LVEASTGKGGRLLAPILQNAAFYWSSDAFRRQHSNSIFLTRAASLYLGGIRVPPQSLQSPVAVSHDGVSSWLREEPNFDLLGHTTDYPILFADLRSINGTPEAVSMGSKHMSESFAKAVEMIQRKLTGEPGDTALPKGLLYSPKPEQIELAEPYFIANWLYGNMIASTPGCEDRASLEEFCLINDLAMMLDPLVLRSTHSGSVSQPIPWFNNFNYPAVVTDYNPVHSFAKLLLVYADTWRELPELPGNWRQKDVTEFQQALLQAAGIDLTMAELTNRTILFADSFFHIYQDNSVVLPELMSTYHDLFTTMLTWRRDILLGGAVLEDLLTDPRKLYEFFVGSVPAFAVGSLVISPKGGYRKGEGVGVDIANLHQFRSSVDALTYGNRSCSLHLTSPRSCAVPERPLCLEIADGLETRDYCSRGLFIDGLLSSIGATSLQWI